MRTPVSSARGPRIAILGTRSPVPGLVRVGLGVLLALILVATIQAQGDGVLEGQVVNGTAGGPDAGAGIAVTLHVFQGDTELDTLETTTDADGRFRFGGLDTDASLTYWPEVVYLDVPYSSAEPYQFDSDQAALVATISVYETTDDDSAIRLGSVHIIAESFGEVMRLSEIHLYGNTGDRTYVGDDGTTVRIPLPESAVGLAFQDDMPEERFQEVEGGFLDTEPVPPGPETSLVFFSYHLVVTGEAIPLERAFAYPVTSLNMLVAQPGLTLNSDQLQAMGAELFQGRQYELYVAQGLAADTPLAMEFVPVAEPAGGQGLTGTSVGSGQAMTGTSSRGNQGLLRWIGFLLAVLAMAGVVVYATTSRRRAPVPASAANLASYPRAQRLLLDLADLEEAFEAGQVDDAAYERQRAELYQALKSL